MGDTLRGLLLYGRGVHATIGTIAGYGAIVAFAGAIGLVLLAGPRLLALPPGRHDRGRRQPSWRATW
jgi:hypothetical protein